MDSSHSSIQAGIGLFDSGHPHLWPFNSTFPTYIEWLSVMSQIFKIMKLWDSLRSSESTRLRMTI